MAIRINFYQARWFFSSDERKGWGEIFITVQNQERIQINLNDAAEFDAIRCMLSDERPLFYDAQNGAIYTSEQEPVGEGEIKIA